MKPTKPQLEFIETMEEFINEKFNGSTKEEARLYIQRNLEEYKLHSNLWATVNGYD